MPYFQKINLNYHIFVGIGHTVFPGKCCLLVVCCHIVTGTSYNQQNTVMIFLQPDVFTATLCDLTNQHIVYLLECKMTPSQFSFSGKITIKNIIIIIIIITFINCNLVVGSGYFTCIQNMKLVTTEFKSGGLHEKHVVATWGLRNHLSICF